MRTAEAAPKIWVCFADLTHNSQKKMRNLRDFIPLSVPISIP